MKTILLRFSDAEHAETGSGTIESHKKIISESGETWWGWWKKDHEPVRDRLLEFVQESASSGSLVIGLFTRKGIERLFRATCVECTYSSNSLLSSPAPKLTPSYYAAGKFPAWFKLTNIVEIDKNSFLSEFGEIPSIDPTLYEVVKDGHQRRVFPAQSWDMKIVPAPGEAIIHLSDLHFGDGHGFPASDSGIDLEINRVTLVKRIRDAVDKFCPLRVGVLVVSGDLISKGDANGYPFARDFIDDVLRCLELDRSHCVIVPGNHDLWTEKSDHPTRDYKHEGGYRMFLGDFYRKEVRDLESVVRFRTPSGRHYVFVMLNSARIRSDNLKEYGYVSRHRYEEMMRYVTGYLSNDLKDSVEATIFVVLHHHVLPVAAVDIPETIRPVSLTLDAGELIEELGNAGVGYILHGHQHLPFVGFARKISSKRSRYNLPSDIGPKEQGIYVLSCGATGARREWLSPEFDKNCIGIYKPKRKNLSVNLVQFSPTSSPEIFWSGDIPMISFRREANSI